MKKIFAYKKQMTQTWDSNGKRLPVTRLAIPKMTVSQVKTTEVDGYEALQLSIGAKAKTPNAPLGKHLAKANITMQPKAIKEIRLARAISKTAGEEITISEVLSIGDRVTVSGVSKGRGFAGVVKRWGFAGGPRTHGQSDRERATGSIGQGTTPGRVHRGKKMPGHYGVQRFSIKNLVIVFINQAQNEVWVSGPVPGAVNGLVEIALQGKTKFAGLYYQPEVIEAEAQVDDEVESVVEETQATPAEPVEIEAPAVSS